MDLALQLPPDCEQRHYKKKKSAKQASLAVSFVVVRRQRRTDACTASCSRSNLCQSRGWCSEAASERSETLSLKASPHMGRSGDHLLTDCCLGQLSPMPWHQDAECISQLLSFTGRDVTTLKWRKCQLGFQGIYKNRKLKEFLSVVSRFSSVSTETFIYRFLHSPADTLYLPSALFWPNFNKELKQVMCCDLFISPAFPLVL